MPSNLKFENIMRMKNINKHLLTVLIIAAMIIPSMSAFAGNEDRAGEAGASQLLINPWARSNGLGGANSAYITGLDAQFLNVAGIAHTKKTEVMFTSTQWLKGSGTTISAFGFTQKMGEKSGVIGFSVVSIGFGEIPVTTVEEPEPGLTTFSPRNMNINLSYAKAFSHSIYGGINLKIISETTDNLKASGVAIDAGIQYVSGKKDQVKFGVALKNVGPNMRFSGDGLSFRGYITGQSNAFTVNQRSASLEMPSLIRIAFSYDFFLGDKGKLTPAYTFTANSFTKDQHAIGLEYKWSKYLMLRAGYTYENGLVTDVDRTTALTGPAAGVSILVPINKDGGDISIDYSYQTSNPFAGTHSIGARINL